MQTAVDRRVTRLEEELTRTRRELEAELDVLSAELLHRAPPGRWSPAQIVWHVAKVERGIARLLERLEAAIAPMETVPPGPRLETISHLMDSFPVLDRSRKLETADELRPPATVDLVAERARLADGRVQLTEVLRKAGPRLSLMRHEHVFFGPLDGWQWVLFVARHEERHLMQLREVVGK